MSLSKSTKRAAYNALEVYFTHLYMNPIRTKSLTSCTILLFGNLTSQCVSGSKALNHNSLIAYGLFGLLFGGTIPHYYYQFLEWAVPRGASLALLKKILIQQLIFTPLYQLFSLYTLTRLEGKSHREAVRKILMIYLPVLFNNWKWLTIPAIVNLAFIPPMLRVLFMNLIGYFWSVYLATAQRRDPSGGSSTGDSGGRPPVAGSKRPAGSGAPRRFINPSSTTTSTTSTTTTTSSTRSPE